MKRNPFLWKLLLVLPLFFSSLTVFGQTADIKGVVTDATTGETLIGVSVAEKGTTNGILTDIDGQYTIKVPSGATLVFTYVGYDPQEVKVTGGTLDIKMKPSQQTLDEIIVIGYGVQKKSVVTAAISSVKASDLEKMTPSRIENVLNGQVSGVSITTNSGQPGSDVNVRIRGVGTTGDNSPLYIIDGMAVDGGIKNLNPADIESVEILKDGASAAVYGTRGGNGVILVTTKRGKEGKPRISYEMNIGWQNPWRKVPMLNSEQYMTLMNEFSLSSNLGVAYTAQNIADARSGVIPTTNWQDVAFNDNAPIQNHEVSIQGGNEKGAYYLSLGRFVQEGILGGNYGASNYDRWSVRMNSDYEIYTANERNFLNKLKVGVNVSYARGNSTSVNNNEVFGTVLSSVMGLQPMMTPYLSEEDGAALLAEHPTALTLNGRVLTPSPVDFQEFRNPLAIYTRPDKTFYDEDKFIGSFWGELSVLPGMTLRSSYGFDLAFWGNNSYRFPFFQSYNTTGANDEDPTKSFAAAEMNRAFTRQIENTLTYNFKFNEHSFTLLAGQSARDMHSRVLTGRGYDLKSYDPNMAIINNARMDIAKGGRTSSGSTAESKLASYFGRISYNYAERYMFQATVRYDGSYKFGTNNKWGTYPSFSLGWNVWNEPAFQSVRPTWWDALKLRGSWGTNGSDRIDPYSYLSLMESGLNYYFGDDMNYGISAGRLPNPYIHWETSTQTDLGADMVFLNSALTFSFDWYKKRTKDMLRDAAGIPAYVGQSVPKVNAGVVDNSGVEFDVSYRFSPVKDLNIGLKVNASYVKNEIVDYGNASGENGWGGIGAAGYDNFIYQRNGFPNPFFYGYETDGLFQNKSEVSNYTWVDPETGATNVIQPKAVPGDVRFKDISGPDGQPDGVIDTYDKKMIGKPIPDWTYGLTLTADYKGFDFNLFFQGVTGNDIFDISRRTDISKANLPAWYMDRWTGEGTSNYYPRIASTGADLNQNWRISDLYIHDGAFTRIKNIQLGYTLPQSITRKATIERLRLWVGAENLFTFTKYNGFDPEIADKQNGVSVMGNYPIARVINCGVGITF